MTYYGDFPTSHTAVCMVFDTFAASTGAPTATTNFANTDVKIYKDGGSTPRSSANGITVSTTFNSLTGIQMVVIDTSDNTDAGFYAAGHEYQVAVADITADSQTLRFWLGCFSIERAGGVLALIKGNAIKVDVNTIKTQSVTLSGGITFPAATVASTTNITAATGIDVTKWNGTTVTAPNTAGTPVVDVGRINNVATTSVTTVSARVGTTSAVLFDGNGNVKADVDSWLGTTVITPAVAGTPDVNVSSINSVSTSGVTSVAASPNAIADALLDRTDAIETGITPRGALRIGVAADAGKTNGMAAAGTAHLRDVADTKNRVTATVDGNGNRTATSVDVT